MSEIRIRVSDDAMLDKLDRLAEQEGYATRSKFIESILARYIVYKDALFVDELPPVIKALCEQAARGTERKMEYLIRANVNTMLKIQQTTDDLRAILKSEYEVE